MSVPKPVALPFFCESSQALKLGTYKEAVFACKENSSSIWSPNLNEPLVREMLEETMHANKVTGLWTGVRRKNDGFSVY